MRRRGGGSRRGDAGLFDPAGRRRGAGAGDQPDTKILFIIRDPVDRALSHLRMTAGRRRWTEIGPDVLEQDLSRVIKRSAYRRNIKRWESVFPRDRFSICPSGASVDPGASCARSRPLSARRPAPTGNGRR